MKMSHPYLLTWLEAARVALSDSEYFDSLAESLDISDDEMIKIRDTLQSFLDEDETIK